MMEQYLNKVTCGDCLPILKSLPDKSIDLVLTDPPYGMSFQSNYRQVQHDKIENDDNLDWLPSLVEESYRVLKDDSHAYFFCSFHNVDVFKQEFQKLFNLKNILIWEKNNTGMGDLFGDYAPQYEMILFCVKGKKDLNDGRDSNILKFQRTQNYFHPTEKPVEIMKYIIGKSSNESNLVLDCFAGGGSTLIACKQLNRNFIGIEREQKYCDIAKDRLDHMTGNLF